MIDPKLERQFNHCSELLDLWRKFHEFMGFGVKGDSITPEHEAQFLHTKSRIAMLHDTFMTALMADRNIGQSVLTIVGRAITLGHLARMSVAEVKKMEIEWHQAFLLLQETLGTIEDKRTEIADVSEASYRAGRARTAAKQRFDRIFKSNAFIGLIILSAVLFCTVGVQLLGIWEWANLRSYGPTKSAFYFVYDKGLRYAFPKLNYYRLDWVKVAAPEDDVRAFLPQAFWVYDRSRESNPPPVTLTDIERDELPNIGLPAATLDEIRGRTQYEEIWCANAQDFIVMALFLMDSSSQASRLGTEIQSAVAGQTTGDRIGATSRANILIVVWLGILNDSQGSRDAFSEFKSRGAELIR
jgi:hypothetical protein